MAHRPRQLLVLLTALTLAALLGVTCGQKVEMDGLEEDQYHKTEKSSRAHNSREQQDKGKELEYVVTEEVYLDILINNSTQTEKPHHGRVKIACFGELTPITCLNFVALAKGYRKGRDWLTYKNTPVHRVVRDFVVQMGDVTGMKGKGGKSIYGDSFEDENFILSHRGAGWVSMANHGKDTNGSQFFILLQPARWLDGRHVVFGKVLEGMDTVFKMAELDTLITGRPKVTVKIVDSGVVGIPSKYTIPLQDLMASKDIAS